MGIHTWERCLSVCLVLMGSCLGHPYFRDRIPNGNNVPNPCKPSETWIGVGHKNLIGSGARNPFGLDFADNGFKWSQALCQKDSDMDGWTNGHELGDPNCTWTQGMPNPTGYTISHPGVCEPWNDPKCLGREESWVMDACKPAEFKCDSVNSSDVETMVLTIPRTKVPTKETTYICQIFSVPNDTDYHIIATTPIIDNVEVMHHSLLFGCSDEVDVSDGAFICGMSPSRHCSTSIVSLWAPGSSGQCMHSSAGFKIGANGFKKIALQLHWNNPKLHDNYFDESGVTVYYTPRLRDNDAGIMTLGQINLLIPPGEERVKQEAVYPGECTQRDLTGNIYITSAFNHMHYLGVHQSLELYRGGVKYMDIAIDANYNYDNPKFHEFEPPLEIRPGDEFRTKCEFSTPKRTHTTRFGPATADEMCFSFVSFYPKQSLTWPYTTSWKSIPYCRLYRGNFEYEGCKFRTFGDLQDPRHLQLYLNITEHCHLFEHCTPECSGAIQEAKKEPCLQGDIWEFVKSQTFYSSPATIEFMMRFQSCDCNSRPKPPSPDFTPITTEESKCNWPGLVKSEPSHPLFPFVTNISSNCIPSLCQKECIPTVLAARGHQCFQGAEWHYGQRYLQQTANVTILKLLMSFDSCRCHILNDMPVTGRAAPISHSIFVFFMCCLVNLYLNYSPN